MKKTVVTTVIAIALVSMLAAFEGPCKESGTEKGKSGWFENKEHNFFEELELSDAQIDQHNKMHLEQQKKSIELQSEIKILELEERESMKNHNFENAKNLTDKIFKIKTELAKSKIEMMKKKWEMLTPEQKEKAEKLMQTRKFKQHPFPKKPGMKKRM